MTIPAPREHTDPGNSSMPSTVLGMIADGLREVKDSVNRLSSDMHEQLSKLPEQYVPRREVERRFDELTIDLGQEQADRKADIKRLEDGIKSAHDRAQSNRRFLITTAVAAAGSLAGVIGGITVYFH